MSDLKSCPDCGGEVVKVPNKPWRCKACGKWWWQVVQIGPTPAPLKIPHQKPEPEAAFSEYDL